MIRTQTRWVCDRCGKLFKMVEADGADIATLEGAASVLVVSNGQAVVEFKDLCEDCARVVAKLIDRISLEKEKKKRDKEEDGGTDAGSVECEDISQEQEVEPEEEKKPIVVQHIEEKPVNQEQPVNPEEDAFPF